MRITYKGDKRRFVHNWKAGRTQAKRVMIKREQVWPGGGARIRRVAFDLSELEASRDLAYWLHALEATAAVSSERCYLGFEVAGRKYRVNTTHDGIALVMYSLGAIDFGENGPGMGDLLVGSEITLTANIPARESLEYNGEGLELPLPYLTDTQLRVCFSKGKKRKWAGRRFEVQGQPSQVVHYGGSCETSEHKRGKKTRILPGNTHKWYHRVYNNVMEAGDKSLVIDSVPRGSATQSHGVTLLWPAFKKTFTLKVTALEYYEPGV